MSQPLEDRVERKGQELEAKRSGATKGRLDRSGASIACMSAPRRIKTIRAPAPILLPDDSTTTRARCSLYLSQFLSPLPYRSGTSIKASRLEAACGGEGGLFSNSKGAMIPLLAPAE